MSNWDLILAKICRKFQFFQKAEEGSTGTLRANWLHLCDHLKQRSWFTWNASWEVCKPTLPSMQCILHSTASVFLCKYASVQCSSMQAVQLYACRVRVTKTSSACQLCCPESFCKNPESFCNKVIIAPFSSCPYQTVWITQKLSGQSQNFPDNPETISRNCPDNLETV